MRAILLALVSTFACAADLYVAPTGTDAVDRGSAAAPFKTLAYAVGRAANGDTVRLAAGTYQETAQTLLKAGVQVRGAGSSGAAVSLVRAPTAWNFTRANMPQNICPIARAKSILRKLSPHLKSPYRKDLY